MLALALACGLTRAILQIAERYHAAVWFCLRAILGTYEPPEAAQIIANFPMSIGGLGLTSAVPGSQCTGQAGLTASR